MNYIINVVQKLGADKKAGEDVLKMKKILAMIFCVCMSASCLQGEACTTTIVTKGASADGSTYVTHSNDSGECDPSIVYVPAKDHPQGSRRNIYPSAIALDELPQYQCYMTPRLADNQRAPGYAVGTANPTIPVGSIPEQAHTYAYIDSDYAIMNEHGLMFGECTNHSRLENNPEPGKRLFYSSELARVALERCVTAREAIKLMGELIDTYGIYGTGETLLVADREEGWVFEMAPSPTGEGGLWVAQKVPDGEFFAAANQFRIRELSSDNPDQLFNSRLIEVLQKAGWAVFDKQSGKLDWLRSMDGVEDFHPYFSLRRVWRAFSLVAPSKHLPARVEGPFTQQYPFSIKPDRPIALDTLTAMHRDSYGGTNFDMIQSIAAGPYGSPYRNGPHATPAGAWERPINTRIIGYTWITQYHPEFPSPLAWIALNTPAESVFVPLAVAPMPGGYEQVNRNVYDRTKPWWIYTQVCEFARDKYGYVIGDIQKKAVQYETDSQELIQASRYMEKEAFAELLRNNAMNITNNWLNFYGELLVKYNQGKEAKYLPGWYQAAGYANGPVKY